MAGGHGGNVVKVILMALAANSLIAAAKLTGAFFSGSASLLAEGIHSLVDCANQLLLLIGAKAATRPPDEKFPMGYGRETFFWSFLVAILLFAAGGGYSIYEGLHKLAHPEPLQHPQLGMGILLLGIILEGISLRACLAEVKMQNRHGSLWKWFRKTTSADLLVIFTEDVAAMLGLVFAFLCIGIAWISGDSAWDAIGSVVVGAVLLITASFLAVEVKSLLIGESAENDYRPTVEALLKEKLPGAFVLNFIALQYGPSTVMVSCKFHPGTCKETAGLIEAVNQVEAALKKNFPEVVWQFFEPDYQD